MKKFIIGLFIGFVLGSAIGAWAATRITLETSAGVELGTTANPLNVSF